VLASALNDRLGTTLPDLKEKPANRKIGTRSFLNEAPVCWCSWFALQCPCRSARCQALYRRTILPPSALLAQSDVLARRQTVEANAATVGCSSGGFATARNLALTAEGRAASSTNASSGLPRRVKELPEARRKNQYFYMRPNAKVNRRRRPDRAAGHQHWPIKWRSHGQCWRPR
jgi:hypothetical protein